MQRILLVFSLFWYSCCLLNGQKTDTTNRLFSATSLTTPSDEILRKNFQNVRLFQIDVNAIHAYVDQQNEQATFRIVFPGLPKSVWTIQAHDLRAPHYSLKVKTSTGEYIEDRPANVTYRGLTDSQTEVRLTLDDNFLYGLWGMGADTWFIEPLSLLVPGGPVDQFLVYRQSDIIISGENTCGAIEAQQKGEAIKETFENQEKIDLCYTVPLALAADFSIREALGGVSNTANYMLGVLNNVHSNYDDEFADEINFQVETTYIVDCAGCDPWTSSTVVADFLDDFRDWGEAGGFGDFYYAIASCWTERDFSGIPIGAAYVGGICNPGKYNVLQHFSNNAAMLRVLNAHEMGHNFGANHDAAGSNTIMAPSVNTSTDWSFISKSVINNSINSNGTDACFLSCTPPPPPLGAIKASATEVCVNSTIAFFDLSTNNPDTWEWTFPGGTPSSSTDQHPVVVYDNPGTYPVSLLVSNVSGDDHVILQNDISVGSLGPQYVLFDSFEDDTNTNNWTVDNPDGGITWQLANVGGTLGGNKAMYVDNFNYPYIGEKDALISPVFDFSEESGMLLEFDYAYRRYSSSLKDKLSVYLSIDGGDTYPYLLFVGTETGDGNFATAPDFDDYFRPTTTDEWCFGTDDFGSSCISLDLSVYAGESNVRIRIENETGYGNSMYVDNISLRMDCPPIALPVADFSSDVVSGCAPLTVAFTDESSGGISQRKWLFEGGIPSISFDQNPTVSYQEAGRFKVQLEVSNPMGEDLIIREDYIDIFGSPTTSFQADIVESTVFFDNLSIDGLSFFWEFGDGNTSTVPNPSHTYSIAGDYTVRLTATNDCGSTTHELNVSISPLLNASFQVEESEGCEGLSVQFTDTSEGNPDSWSWQFEGGVPATSNEQNPTIFFPEGGNYSVSLTVNNAFRADSIYLEDYITILEAPAAGFDMEHVPYQNTAYLNSDAIGAADISWSIELWNGDTVQMEGDSISYDFLVTGTYPIRQIVSNSCGQDTLYDEITIQLPELALSETDSCAPLIMTYELADSLSAEYTYVWHHREEGGMNETIDTGIISQINYESSGVYEVYLEVFDTDGSLLVEVMYPSLLALAEAPTSMFQIDYTIGNSYVNLYDTGLYADSLYWQISDGATASGDSMDHTFFADGTYQIDLISYNECGDNNSQQDITIITAPRPRIGFIESEGCAPFTTTFYATPATGVGDIAYNWFFAGASPSILSGDTVEVNYTTPGVFNVTLTAQNAAGDTSINLIDLIEVYEPLSVSFQADYTLGNLNVSFLGDSPNADSLFWEFGDGNTASGTAVVYNYLEEGVYTVLLTAFNACSSTTTSQTLTIILPPVAGVMSDIQEGCFPLEVQFSAQNQREDYNYQWIFEGGIPASSTEANPLVIFSSSGEYDVSLLVSNEAGQSELTEIEYISIWYEPEAAFSLNPNGFDVQLNDASTNAESYLWDFGDGDTSTLANPMHTYTANGIYEIQQIVWNSCGADTTTLSVEINESMPLVSFSVNENMGCAPLSVQFTNNSTNGDSYEWSFPGGTPSSSNETNPTVIYSEPGIYDVILIATNQVGSSSLNQAALMEVNTLPQGDFLFGIDQLAVTFINTSSSEESYYWDFGDGVTSTLENPIHTYAADGNYEVQLIVSNLCGNDTISQTLELEEMLLPMATFSADTIAGCVPLTVQYSSTFAGPVDSILWVFAGGFPSQSTALNPTVEYAQTGTYDVSLYAANEQGDEWVVETDYIDVLEGEAPIAGNMGIGQDGPNLLFLISATGDNLTYNWDFGDGKDTVTLTGMVEHVYAVSGLYRVILRIDGACGSVSQEVQVNVVINATAEPIWGRTLSLYPNPSSDRAWLGFRAWPSSGNMTLRWFDARGRFLKQRDIYLNGGSGQEPLQIQDMRAGMYWLEINWNGEKLYRRLVVQ